MMIAASVWLALLGERERGVEGWSEFVKKGPPLPFLFLYNALQGSFSSSFHKEIVVAR